ncbi:hypothetical protein BDV95DRAFT_591658 [Massariosphaeria phaeospora]|uniref:SWI5-dependent HO expression protein 3 n=1 Tax=Massariosphaeria phaeospora TaxID=100035 RepID=A0A7C8IE77_9PLEO|nr:hypothetical protein BDV95DRAFT_591658 [Massariosphaeria phaeospora]
MFSFKKKANATTDKQARRAASAPFAQFWRRQPAASTSVSAAPHSKLENFNADSRTRQAAPVLPNLPFSGEHDMTDSGHSNDDTITKTPPPTRSAAMPSYTTPRNVSGPLSIISADANANRASPHVSAAVPQSKTSQYIDKITSENERLRRELAVERTAKDAAMEQLKASQVQEEKRQAEYQHLQVLADTNARAMDRKDRKLADLKAALDIETSRRKDAEQRAAVSNRMLGDTQSETNRELAKANDLKHLAETNADAARDGFKRITDGYKKQLKSMNEHLHELRQKRVDDADKIRRQAIISDQLQHEMVRMLRSENNMTSMMETYKQEHEKLVDDLVQEAERMRAALPQKEKEAEELIKALQETQSKMKWVMTQKKRQDEK